MLTSLTTSFHKIFSLLMFLLKLWIRLMKLCNKFTTVVALLLLGSIRD